MRDARHIQERVDMRMERSNLVWLTLGMVVALGLTFALGFAVGQRSARIEPADPADPIAQIESDQAVHEQLTFYTRLKESRKATVEAESKAEPPPKPAKEPVHKPTPAVVTPKTEPDEATPSVAAAVARARDEAGQQDNASLKKSLNAGPPTIGKYTVQVSAYRTEAEAKAYSAGLERKGYRPFVVSSRIAGRGTWYRVRMGSFEDEKTAARAKAHLAQADIPAWVLKSE